jgi:hypothetical protein
VVLLCLFLPCACSLACREPHTSPLFREPPSSLRDSLDSPSSPCKRSLSLVPLLQFKPLLPDLLPSFSC